MNIIKVSNHITLIVFVIILALIICIIKLMKKVTKMENIIDNIKFKMIGLVNYDDLKAYIQRIECKKCASKVKNDNECKLCLWEDFFHICYAKDEQYVKDKLQILQTDEKKDYLGE